MSTIQTGYKQTEGGVIPEDWEVSKLSSLGEIIRGASPRPKGDKRYFGGNIPRLMVEDVTRDGKFVIPQIDFLTTEGAKRSRPCKKGTLTIVCSGTVGIVSFLGVDACIHDGFLALVGLRRSVSDDYVFHKLSALREKFDSSATHGGVFTNLTTTGVKEFAISIPPSKAEQEAIAGALSDADSLIESLEQLIAKKRKVKQGTMQELLTGKKRLPGFFVSGKFITNQLGTYPTEWNLFRLKDLVDPFRSIRYGIVQPGQHEQNGRFMIRGQDYSESKGWAKAEDVFRVSEHIEARYRNARVQTGDLIMTIVGYCGHVEVVPSWLNGANLTQTTARIAILPSKAVALFCKYMLQTALGRNQVGAFIKGAAQPGLNCGDVEEFLLPLPPLAEQSAIAEILSDMDAEIAELDTQLSKARALKQGMMHKLLTGEIRLL